MSFELWVLENRLLRTQSSELTIRMNERDQIKDRIDIVELINEYVPLKKAGANFKAPCPFHQEKTPSFMVSPSKQIWHCFGCGKGGDAFTFLMEKEGMDFPEALRTLAKKTGVELKPRNPKIWTRKNKLYEINNLAARYFHEAFWKSREGEAARQYMKQRKFTKETLDNFLVGYSPDSWDILSAFLRKKGYSEEEINNAGLTVRKDQGGFYDRFRGRLMFPIKNAHGDAVAFGARQLKSEDTGAKYINTPETEIYQKSWVLYGLSDARSEIRGQDLGIIVEGYTDVLASHQVGIKNVVASSGTALTEGHLDLLKRYTNNLVLAFDMDLAGDMATKRGIDLALNRGFDIKVAKLPVEKDPADVALADPKSWKKIAGSGQPIMKYFFTSALAGKNLEEAADKKEIAAELLPVIKKIGNEIERHHYIQTLAEKINVPEDSLISAMRKVGVQRRMESAPEKFPSADRSPTSLESRFLGLLLKNPGEIEYVLDHFDVNFLAESAHRNLYLHLEKFYNTNRSYTADEFLDYLKKDEVKLADLVSTLLLEVDKDFEESDAELFAEELKSCINLLEKSYLKKRLRELSDEVSRAEKVEDTKAIENLTSEFTRLTNQLRETEKNTQ